MSAEELGFDPSIKKKKKSKDVAPVSADSETTTVASTEDDDLFSGLKKKKKKSKDKKDTSEEPSADVTDDLSESFEGMKLKKKKKKKVVAADIDEFEKQLQDAGIDESIVNETSKKSDLIPYSQLLDRFYGILKEKNPELAGGQQQKLKIPPPEVLRDGNKKTIFANVQQISQVLQRNPSHLIQYLFAELGTSGSIDGEQRLIIKGRFQSKNIEGVLRRYIQEYVICRTCKSMNTELKREAANRLHFIVCKACGSTKSVTSIRTGFTANVGAMKKKRV
ncbi:translation initiation factor eIF2 subunit beta [Pichia kluyveri]|uniref:Translation initiation factor eIF2 subunit beta n=1 Tax=Pichia kluyveri TaxID=36015 RepID=A0AAV5R3N6_PICKL|nr:translation initiation factor eIF2 subunit beta [Pichia kluyveri]